MAASVDEVKKTSPGEPMHASVMDFIMATWFPRAQVTVFGVTAFLLNGHTDEHNVGRIY